MLVFSADEIIERLLKVYSVRQMKDLAELLGISAVAVTNWKKRNSVPTEVLFKTVQEKGVSLDWLVYGKEEQGRTLDPLEDLLLSSFNELDNKAKMSILSLIHNGGKAQGGVSQTSGDNGVNNVFSGDNLTINR